MIKKFNSWLTEQSDPLLGDPMAGGDATAVPAAPAPVAQIRAILISNPIGSVDKPGDMTTRQFNEYVLDMDRVKEWIEKNEKAASQEILDYLAGKDIDIKDSHKKFSKAVQANEFGKPQTVIDVDFTKDGEPTTKDINLIFLG